MAKSYDISVTWAAVMVTCAIGLGHGSTAQGQNELGDGHNLDANLQRGSGGRNAPAQTLDFSARNDVITGNVTGLGYFHDDVGYGASGDFGDRLSGDDLFRFRARSLSSSQSSIPGGGSTYGSASSGQVSVYRSPWAVGVKNVVGSPSQESHRWDDSTAAYRASGLVVRPSGGAGRFVDSFRSSRSTPGWDVDAYQQRIGTVIQPEGRVLEIKASPLLGMRSHEVDRVDVGTQTQDGTQQQRSGDPAAESQTDQRVGALPAVKVGRQIQQMMMDQQQTQQQMDRLGGGADQLVAQIEAGLFGPLDAADGQPGESVYKDLLAQIKQDQALVQDMSGASEPDRRDTAEGDSHMGLKGPSDDQLADAGSAWRRTWHRAALRGSRGDQADAAQASKIPGTLTQDQPDPLQRLLDKLDYNLPPVATLAGKRDTTINQLIRQAQDELRAGRFMDAQEHYQHVLQQRPDDPMGRVGLVHAQIGAGMLRSAAVNLQRLFDHHPELIAARYDPALLPDAQRLQWVTGELIKWIESDNQVAHALLLAYLGYQSNEPRLVKYGLDRAGSHSPDDPLVKLVRRIWLDRDKSLPAAPETKRNQ